MVGFLKTTLKVKYPKNLKGEYLDDLTDIECSNAWDVAIDTVCRIINNPVEHIMEAIEKQFSDQEVDE